MSTKAITFVMTVVVAVAAALAGLSYWKLRSEVVDGVEREIAAIAAGRAATIQEWIGVRKRIVETSATGVLADDPKPPMRAAAAAAPTSVANFPSRGPAG